MVLLYFLIRFREKCDEKALSKAVYNGDKNGRIYHVHDVM